MDIPFTYNLPNSTSGLYYTGRKIDDDHAAIFEMAEDLLIKSRSGPDEGHRTRPGMAVLWMLAGGGLVGIGVLIGLLV